jgi:hypothetical protein
MVHNVLTGSGKVSRGFGIPKIEFFELMFWGANAFFPLSQRISPIKIIYNTLLRFVTITNKPFCYSRIMYFFKLNKIQMGIGNQKQKDVNKILASLSNPHRYDPYQHSMQPCSTYISINNPTAQS